MGGGLDEVLRGYVVAERVPQERRPDREMYRIKEEGRQALEAWFEGEGMPLALGDDLLDKIVLADLLGRTDVIETMRREQHLRSLALDEIETITGGEEVDRTNKLTTKRMELNLKADIKWLSECEGYLSNKRG